MDACGKIGAAVDVLFIQHDTGRIELKAIRERCSKVSTAAGNN